MQLMISLDDVQVTVKDREKQTKKETKAIETRLTFKNVHEQLFAMQKNYIYL